MQLHLVLQDTHQPLFIVNLKERIGSVLLDSILMKLALILLVPPNVQPSELISFPNFDMTGEESVAHRMPFLWSSVVYIFLT